MRGQFLAQLHNNLSQLQHELGEEWDAFSEELMDCLVRLINEEDVDNQFMCVDRIFLTGIKTAAGQTFYKMFFPPEKSPVMIFRWHLRSGKEVILKPDTTAVSQPVMADIAAAILEKIQPDSAVSVGSVSNEISAGVNRYLQSTFSSEDPAEPMTGESPLAMNGGPYTLTLHIGPGEGDVPFPEEAVRDEYEEDKLDIQVGITGRGLQAALLDESPILTLPRRGESSKLSYQITPQSTGRGRLDVDLLYKGNLLQRRQIDIAVVAQIGDPVPPSALPPQSHRTTYTIVGQLSQEALARWEERVITLVVERDPHDASYLINIHQGAALLCRYDCHQTDLSLRDLVPVLRHTLAGLSEAFGPHPDPAAAKELVKAWLPWLAYQGRQLYHTIFRHSQVENPTQGLPVGSVIQATPIGPRATLPWGMVYDRPFDRQGGLTRQDIANAVCPAWLEGYDCVVHGCPHAQDETIACPSGFWGYRYIIEQIPAGLGKTTTGELPLIVKNGNGTHFNMNAFQFKGLNLAEQPFRQLAALSQDSAPQFSFHLNTTVAAFKTHLKKVIRDNNELHVLYFYAHGGKTEDHIPYLRLGNKNTTDYLARDTLDELGVKTGALANRPLVFLNACESGNYTPDDYESFIEAFYQAGACGLIGTECAIRQKTARAVAKGFFLHFLTGKPAGESLWLAGRELLAQFNPLGLVYSLYASGLVRLDKELPPATLEIAWQGE